MIVMILKIINKWEKLRVKKGRKGSDEDRGYKG